MNSADLNYSTLASQVLNLGRKKKNRTGVDTFSIFGAQARFDLQEGFPLLTTKKVFFRGVLEELLWFLRGETNIKSLVDKNVHIWDAWPYKKYLELMETCLDKTKGEEPLSQKEFIEHLKESKIDSGFGELGYGTYGSMWRNFPFHRREGAFSEERFNDVTEEGTVDQIEKAIETLKTNPSDRRILVSAWHPYWVDRVALPPCHTLFHFMAEEMTEEESEAWAKKNEGEIPKHRLNCLLYQRSADLFLGVPFNIASYALLTKIIAKTVGMAEGEFVHTFGDLHIYENHIEQVKEQISRLPRDLPEVTISKELSSMEDIESLEYSDFVLSGYDPHPAIKGEVAV